MISQLEVGDEELLLFISDLHLCVSRPQTTTAFLDFLAGDARSAAYLFILGDLFEYWLGDDDDAPLAAEVAVQLERCHASGVRCFFMHGNRDFLLGERYARNAKLTLLQDPTRIIAGRHELLLMHGDALCTDDRAYQEFRAQVRSADWQRDFLARPLAQRRSLAGEARRQSESAKQEKAPGIMDANPQAVDSVLRENSYPILIHGHTHRIQHHSHLVDGRSCSRWVLPDWNDHAHYLSWRLGRAQFVERTPPAATG